MVGPGFGAPGSRCPSLSSSSLFRSKDACFYFLCNKKIVACIPAGFPAQGSPSVAHLAVEELPD